MNSQLLSSYAVISKYEGLQRIEIVGLPHPKWIFATNETGIPRKPWTDAPHGWTIRCAPKTMYEFGMPARHRLKFNSLRRTLKSFLKKLYDHSFVIYPSWQYDRSGSCHVEIDKAFIEVVIGDIGPLLAGKKSPDAVFAYDGPLFIHASLITGNSGILPKSDRALLAKSCRKVSCQNTVVLEWVKTSERRILFYDWFECKR